MSAAIEEATTTEGLPDVESSGAQPSTEESEQSKEMTLMEKVRNDPEFAVEQIRKRDAQISERSNRLKEFETLQPYIEAAGGSNQLLNLATFGSKVGDIPGLAEFVQKSIAEGRVALPEQKQTVEQDDPADQWMDEDTKRVRDEARAEVSTLREEIADLKRGLVSASARTQTVHVQSNIDRALSVFGDVAEGKEEAMQIIEQQVKNAQRMAEQGDAKQAALIDQLASPEGEQILGSIIYNAGLLQKYGPQIFGGQNTQTEEVGSVLGKATDAPSKVSRPGSPTIERPTKESAGSVGTFLAVLNQVRQQNGRAPI